MKSLFVILLLLVASSAFAQSGAGAQDTSGNENLRPRWDSYIVGVYPSPAHVGQQITVQTYNHNPAELSVKVYDGIGRMMLELLPKQQLPGGLQTFTIPASNLSSGSYVVKLVTYTASGAIDIVDETHFLIVH